MCYTCPPQALHCATAQKYSKDRVTQVSALYCATANKYSKDRVIQVFSIIMCYSTQVFKGSTHTSIHHYTMAHKYSQYAGFSYCYGSLVFRIKSCQYSDVQYSLNDNPEFQGYHTAIILMIFATTLKYSLSLLLCRYTLHQNVFLFLQHFSPPYSFLLMICSV